MHASSLFSLYIPNNKLNELFSSYSHKMSKKKKNHTTNHKKAWLNMGCDCQFWHPPELPPETLLVKMSLAHTHLVLLSPKAAPALLRVCNLC